MRSEVFVDSLSKGRFRTVRNVFSLSRHVFFVFLKSFWYFCWGGGSVFRVFFRLSGFLGLRVTAQKIKKLNSFNFGPGSPQRPNRRVSLANRARPRVFLFVAFRTSRSLDAFLLSTPRAPPHLNSLDSLNKLGQLNPKLKIAQKTSRFG